MSEAKTEATIRRKKIADILNEETGSTSYKAHKYSLESNRPLDYGEADDRTFAWKKTGETDPPKKHKNLHQLSQTLAERDEQVLTYFLDGSRHVYKVEDRSYPSGGRILIYPTIAGQVGVGICKRKAKKMVPEALTREFVISVPKLADPNGKNGFFEALCDKLNNHCCPNVSLF